MKRKIYRYAEIVDQCSLLFLTPGLSLGYGGMYNYSLMWLDEIKKFDTISVLYLKEQFFFKNKDSIEFRNFFTDKNLFRIKILSLLGIFFPVILTYIFRKNYEKVARKYEVIHILTSSLSAYLLIKGLLGVNSKLKIIYTIHDPKSHDEKRSLVGKYVKQKYLNKIYNLSIKEGNFFIHIHSSKLISEIPNYCKNVIVHPHPLPKKLVLRSIVTTEKIKIGFLGRIEPYKGLDILYEAFKLLEGKIDKSLLEILIVGRGEINNSKWINQLSFETRIDNGIVSDIEFHEYMASIDCLVLPYKKASQSGVGYLGLAYDKPIIASDTGGLSDIIAQSTNELSTLIKPSDSKQLATEIEKFVLKVIGNEAF